MRKIVLQAIYRDDSRGITGNPYTKDMEEGI
jgi:hypothetical protein